MALSSSDTNGRKWPIEFNRTKLAGLGPGQERMKRIIICADGTWNKPDQKDRGRRKPTNVVKIARAILPVDSDGVVQTTFYHPGVGTNWGLDKIAGGGFGLGLSANILDAYSFIVLNYVEGDEIFLFGFSRGAYTVRSLAGLLNEIGILPKNNAYFMPEAYSLYRKNVDLAALTKFREEQGCMPGPVKYIGVWDTVGSLGIPIGLFKSFNKRYEFHEVGLTENIRHAYHALAIDERRRPFKPSIWQLDPGSSQTLQQVWFPGVHSNVGGGYEKDGLANAALHWIKGTARNHGLQLDSAFLGNYRPYSKHEMRKSMKLIYRIMIPTRREIGVNANTNEAIHRSAIERQEAIPDYNPDNLKDALANNVPVCEERYFTGL